MTKNSENAWASVSLTDIFPDIQRGRRLKSADHIEGNMPYVSSSGDNNGIDDFVANNGKGVRIFSDCISLANSGSVGSAFYEPFKFVASDHITHLKNKDFDKDTYLFLIATLEKLSEKYNFNREVNDYRISRERIMLPVKEGEGVDYDYMRTYVKEMYECLLNRYFDYVEKQLDKLGEPIEILKLSEKEYASYQIADLFEIVKGKEGNMSSLPEGRMPLISARNTNNGVKGFVETEHKTIKGNCITLNNDGDGGAGLAYYQPHEFAIDTHVTALIPKENIDMYAQMFIAERLSGLHEFFGHGLSIANRRVKNLRVVLPKSNKENTPDYEYMCQYTKNLIIKKYQQYLSYKKNN